MIEQPLSDADAWVLSLSTSKLPVLRRTAQALYKLGEQTEVVNSRTLSAVILQDPLMTLRVFSYLAEHRRNTQLTDVTTIDRALMMIGIGPFFRDFDKLLLIEDHLMDYPKALLGLLKVITRSRRASHWAHDWAVHRHDLDVDEITLAALLHDVAEILMWCFAPTLALQVETLKIRDPHLRSVSAQVDVYGITLVELQRALVHFWGLPELLTMLMDHSGAENQRVKNVLLAVDLARHSANGWSDAAIPDDLQAIQTLLHINKDMLPMKLGVDVECLASLINPLSQPSS